MFEAIVQIFFSLFLFIASFVDVNSDIRCNVAINGDPNEHYCWDSDKEELSITRIPPVLGEATFDYDEPLRVFGRIENADPIPKKTTFTPTSPREQEPSSSTPQPNHVNFEASEEHNFHRFNRLQRRHSGHRYEDAFSHDYLHGFSPQNGGGNRYSFSGSARDFDAWSALARMEVQLRAYTNQKAVWISRTVGRTNGELTPQQAREKKEEDDQIIPCLLARLENQSGGEKCNSNWGILTNNDGLVMSWEWDFPTVNNRRPYAFFTKPNDFIGSWVRDVYNYALNLNMQALNSHNYEDLKSSLVAIDFVEHADRKLNSVWLGFAERIVDFRTGRFKAKGYDKETLDPQVAQHFGLSLDEPTLLNFELKHALNGFAKHVPHSKDDTKALSVSDIHHAVILAALMALSEGDKENWSGAYAFIAQLHLLKNFVDAMGDGFAEGTLDRFNIFMMMDEFASLGLAGINLLEDAFDHPPESSRQIADFFVVLFNSSPEIFSIVWDTVKHEIETNPKLDITAQNASLHGFYAGMIASLFANPLKGVSKFGALLQKGKKGRIALEDLSKRIAKRLAKNPGLEKPLGRGSTADLAKGSTKARNLGEQLAIEEVERDPTLGMEIGVKMTDPRWPHGAGWQKRQHISKPGGEPIVIHYLHNKHTNQIDDFKIIVQKPQNKH